MLRVGACLTLLLAGRAAAMEVAIEDPPIFQCRAEASWEKVVKCVSQLGTPTILGESPRAKLIRVVNTAGGGYLDYGVYLYVEQGKRWELGGMYNGSDEVTGFTPFDSAGVHGYRIDLAYGIATTTRAEDGTVVAAYQATRQQLLCEGPQRIYCLPLITRCDLYIAGRSRGTFRGTVEISGKTAKLVGDVTKAGACAISQMGEIQWHD